MRKILLIFILVINFSIQTKAQTYVLIPDNIFASYLQGLIPAAMNGNSLNITSTLVTTGTRTLLPVNLGILNLSGIEYFPSLKYLDCSFNNLSSLPTLPDSLTTLFCSPNQLTSLPALPNLLIILDCSNNHLTSLPTLPNSLNQLDCIYNNIVCFPVFPASLNFVYLSHNPFTCLPNYVLPAMNNYTNTPLCASACTVTGIKELNPNNYQISIYPNPSSSIIHIKNAPGNSIDGFVIIDVFGRKVLEQKENISQINIQNLERGLYHLLITSEGNNYSNKFIKE